MSAVVDPSSTVPDSERTRPPTTLPFVVLTGNPNCGKTTLFNALTGLRARVGNYAGVTVERKEGRLQGTEANSPVAVLDLPGSYSLSPQSLDEQVARDILFHRLAGVPAPSLVVVVVDASNLQRNLYYATQVIELGYPTLIALNMIDVAEENGHFIDATQLGSALGLPVLPIVASKDRGVPELRRKIIQSIEGGTKRTIPRTFCELPLAFGAELESISALLTEAFQQRQTSAQAEALLVLCDEKVLARSASHYPDKIRVAIEAARIRLEAAGVDWRSVTIEARYARIAAIAQAVTTEKNLVQETFSDKLDRIVTHRIWGMAIFIGIMMLMFWSIFTFARIPMDFLQDSVAWLGGKVAGAMPDGALNDLLVKGIIKGVGAVLVFLPQICLLFLFIGLLEDTGYMARAAFLMDRLMSKVGLHGKSFIPMLSSFACAIPGIMATRTIETPKDRLVTILVAPLMSCSARLPVYTLLIAACFPDRKLMATLVMLSMYLLGIVVALAMAWLLKKTLLKGEAPLLIMELPPYKRPLLRVVLRHMWDRSKLFLRRAGTVILGINIILWFLASYPRHADVERAIAARKEALLVARNPQAPNAREMTQTRERQMAEIDNAGAGERLRGSFAGWAGRAIAPFLKPLGFDWKIGIGIISSFAAREVFVSTMSIVYNVGEKTTDEEAHTKTLSQTLRVQKRENGAPVYTTLTCISLMVFYVLALQCVSTVAVVRRETNSWKWPVFQWVYMGLLAWILTFVTYQGGRLLGFS
jgi:ferrous iron transport protein B